MSENTSQPTAAVHWIGAGLSSGPGIMALARQGVRLTVWDMTSDRAEMLNSHLDPTSRFEIGLLDLNDAARLDHFCSALSKGDIIISMLPAAFHVQVAKLALAHDCHMVTSSYLSDDMLALQDEACAKGLSIVNEVGLDPGIDHLFTHVLVDSARTAGVLDQGHAIDFISYCGGIPVENTPFTYKFSWTPLGVMTALKNPARMIKNGAPHDIARAWEEVTSLDLDGETFEVYANRNSLPYVDEYGLGNEKNLRTFVRGTLRLNGWKNAWKDIFATVEHADLDELKSLSDTLWRDHPYKKGEQDRVVLHVALTATPNDGGAPWHGSLSLDHAGADLNSAMATCVSLTVAQAVMAVAEGRLAPGVQPSPHDVGEAKRWLQALSSQGLPIKSDNVSL
ncbi:saccharopine dehydrogenase family protein [Paremcibacter congregatus]|uniref:saccharopine dehydrogenase family protein n=1 Tax=Paremcibacter congregatus TaxID=2043170 RepID=UPI003A94E1B3|tara:strand:- start:9423 stop:10604 length:1182 start_codon:yes stop_codon:yes gene_type:complete